MCIKSPHSRTALCVRWYVLGLMKLDKSIFEGVVPIVIDRKRLSHPDQPSHTPSYVSWLLWARQWLAQNSLPCLPAMPLDGPRWGSHTLSEQQLLFAAPAADEIVAILSPPNQTAWKPCCRSWLCTAVRLHIPGVVLSLPWLRSR